MHRRSLLSLTAAGLALPPLAASARSPAAPAGYRLSGPFVHENLAVYLIHGADLSRTVPLTLQEAMRNGTVKVHDVGDVNQLQIENLGSDEVFVQSGDIVKGGKQDRVLMMSLLLPGRSGRVPIASFCVEQGRWAARGKEDVQRFSSAEAALPSREAKLAMKAPSAPERVAPGRPSAGDTGARQQMVWQSVAKTQDKLARGVGAPVAAAQSQTSLQLSLENERVRRAQHDYVRALRAVGEQEPDVIGFAFAVGGKLNSADVYPSNGLFRKMWPKLLDASATEAIGEKSESGGTPPTLVAVGEFLDTAERGNGSQRPLPARTESETRDGATSLYVEARRAAGGGWYHRNYIAKH
jgi:hypothetical protein